MKICQLQISHLGTQNVGVMDSMFVPPLNSQVEDDPPKWWYLEMGLWDVTRVG